MIFQAILFHLVLALASAGFAAVICRQRRSRLHPPSWWIALLSGFLVYTLVLCLGLLADVLVPGPVTQNDGRVTPAVRRMVAPLLYTLPGCVGVSAFVVWIYRLRRAN